MKNVIKSIRKNKRLVFTSSLLICLLSTKHLPEDDLTQIETKKKQDVNRKKFHDSINATQPINLIFALVLFFTVKRSGLLIINLPFFHS